MTKTIEIDGVWYDENLNPILIKSVTCNGVTFTEGEQYQNYYGVYEVVGFSDDEKRMSVRYVKVNRPEVQAGDEKTYPVAAQADAMRLRRIREEAEMKMRDIDLTGHNESFTLGFLARHAFVCVRVKESSRQWFEETHRKLTGELAPTPNIGGNYYNVSLDDTKGSGDYFHVGFQTPPDYVKTMLSFGNKDSVHWDVFGTLSKYNSMNYVLNILRLGFRVGKNHDVDRIREKVEDKEAFDKGYLVEMEERIAA